MGKRGLGFWGETAEEYLAVAQQAEAAGFHSVWSNELHRTALVQLAAIATRTSRVKLGTGIVLAFVRSPFITALEALDLDEIAQGRLILGLGSGVQRLNENWYNVRFGKPVPHLREMVQVIRLLLESLGKGDPISFEGEYTRLNVRGYRRPYRPAQEHIPIYLAGVGPLMVRLAGEVADGWLGHDLGAPRYPRDIILPRLQEGLDRAGRSRQDIQVCPSAICAISRDPREARRAAAGMVAFYATVRTYTSFFAFHGFESVLPRVQEAFRRGAVPTMLDAVPDEMVDAYTVSGTIDQVRKKLAVYDEVSDMIKLSPPYHHVPPEVSRFHQQQILELLGE